MSRTGVAAAAAAAMLLAGAPALANVKDGVDAWSRGEYRKAVEQWRPAAIAGDADAQFNLGQAYKLGRGVPVDLALAEEWYRKAALQGHFQAEANYGLALFQNGKRAEAAPWLERAAGRGEPRAQLVLGTMLFNADGVAKDWVRAYALLQRASAAGLPQASQTLAQMDQYIPADVRQQGIALARQYETSGQAPQNPPELAGAGSVARPSPATGTAPAKLRGADLPASSYAADGDVRQPPGTGKPPRQTVPARTPPVVSAPPPGVATAPPPRPEARPAPGNGRGWRVQFGAFRDDGNARGLWQTLQPKVSSLAALQSFLVKSGSLTKLQAGPIASGAEANRVCADIRVRAKGTPCVVVAP